MSSVIDDFVAAARKAAVDREPTKAVGQTSPEQGE